MGNGPPAFFEAVRAAAEEEWRRREAEPRWRNAENLLFEQVQDPHHVISELLQNADDAGAKRVSVEIKSGLFVFRHDGKDFAEDDFASICRFAFSNKRSVHTIGFRGIGFRSVFSVGDSVEIRTPALAFRFDRSRFTVPVWIDAPASDETEFSVRIRDADLVGRMEKEIEKWGESPLPLIFFREIRSLRLGGREIRKEIHGAGPTKDSKSVALTGIDHDLIVLRSADEPFPNECQEEIRRTRNIGSGDLPPCPVSVILGGEDRGRVYVVLPTEIRLPVACSCNAPFIQDPARRGIIDPSQSATNRWLLDRIGRLMGEAMISWLGRTEFLPANRARAYDLLPDEPGDGFDDLSTVCAQRIDGAVEEAIMSQPVVLAEDGALRPKGEAVAFPAAVLEAWPSADAIRLFTPGKASALSPAVSGKRARRLRRRGLVDEAKPETIVARLKTGDDLSPPRPEPPERLLPVWAFVWAHLTSVYNGQDRWPHLAIVPAEGSDRLFPATDVIAGRDRPAHFPEDDWRFLTDRVRIVDAQFAETLATMDDDPEAANCRLEKAIGRGLRPDEMNHVRAAYEKAGLSKASDAERIVKHAAAAIFGARDLKFDDARRLLLIAWRLDVSIGGKDSPVKFRCRDGSWCGRADGIIAPSAIDLETLFPADWLDGHLIDPEYEAGLDEKARGSWRDWLLSKGGIRAFPLPERQEAELNRTMFLERYRDRLPSTSFVEYNPYFEIIDFDWPMTLVDHWTKKGRWGEVIRAVATDWRVDADAWKDLLRVEVTAIGPRGGRYPIGHEIAAAWLHHLRSGPSLPDVAGHLRVPVQLYRRTNQTRDRERVSRDEFLHPDWDDSLPADFLDLLGVRSKPGEIRPILDRLEALARADAPPLPALIDFYRIIESEWVNQPVEKRKEIASYFRTKCVIRARIGDKDSWETSNGVYLSNEQGVPGLAVIHPELKEEFRGLWTFLGVRSEPSGQDALDWLMSIPHGEDLPADHRDRIASILKRYSEGAWREVGRWLNLRGEFVERDAFRWRSHDPRLTKGLYDNIKMNCADFTNVDASAAWFATAGVPPSLEASIHLTVESSGTEVEDGDEQPWIEALGAVLARIGAGETGKGTIADYDNDRREGERLSRTRWRRVDDLRVQEVLDGTPVGAPRSARVAWEGDALYATGPSSRLHKEIASELARRFRTAEAKETIRTCIGRDTAWIDEYADENLRFSDEAATPDASAADPSSPSLPASLTREPAADDEAEVEAERALREMNRTRLRQAGAVKEASETAEDEAEVDESPDLDPFVTWATARGFRWGDGGLVHPDGDRFEEGERPFPWVLIRADGMRLPIFIAKGSLANGIEVSASVWSRIRGALKGFLLEGERGFWNVHHLSILLDRERIEMFQSGFRFRAKVPITSEPSAGFAPDSET